MGIGGSEPSGAENRGISELCRHFDTADGVMMRWGGMLVCAAMVGKVSAVVCPACGRMAVVRPRY